MARQSLTTRLEGKKRDERYDTFINSFDEPYPMNPLRFARIKRDLTLQGLGDLVGLSKQTLIRAEQGLFDEPPVKLVSWLVSQGENELELVDGYHDFQLTVRARHRRLFGDALGDAEQYTDAVHPLEWLLTKWSTGELMNVTEMAKLLCVSQPLLNHWLRTPKQVKVPGPLVSAFIQNGYSKREIKVFVDAYKAYRKNIGY